MANAIAIPVCLSPIGDYLPAFGALSVDSTGDSAFVENLKSLRAIKSARTHDGIPGLLWVEDDEPI